jgi:hypothetical protein
MTMTEGPREFLNVPQSWSGLCGEEPRFLGRPVGKHDAVPTELFRLFIIIIIIWREELIT